VRSIYVHNKSKKLVANAQYILPTKVAPICFRQRSEELEMIAKRQKITIGVLVAVVSSLASAVVEAAQSPPKPDHVIVVTMDGFRWQEVFDGAQRELVTGPDGGVADTSFTLQRFWRDDPAQRRSALFPFLWGTVAREGLLLGDSVRGSAVRVTNGKRFSYPGYNELFTGAADGRIDSNDKVPNPNVTVLEWLAGRPGFAASVAVYGSWDVFPFIFNVDRSKLPVNGDGLPFPKAANARETLMNRMVEWTPTHWRGARLDIATMAGTLETLTKKQPRVLAVLLGETDEWAHERRYDLYLDAARRSDRFIQLLWETAQSLPAYRGRTSLIIATDHGRGNGREWSDHGREVPAAERIWMAVMGPSVTRKGVGAGQAGTQSQFAATIAKLLGEDWQSARPNAAAPIAFR
jgi:hypothetical protein